MSRLSIRRVDHERTLQVTPVHPLPGVRPVVMLADYQPPTDGRPESWDVYPIPVLGVQVETVETWYFILPAEAPAPSFPGTARAARRAGWQRDGDRQRVLYLVPADGEIVAQSVLDFEQSVNTACRAYLATWPEAEDMDRLAEKIGELKSWAKLRWADAQAAERRER